MQKSVKPSLPKGGGILQREWVSLGNPSSTEARKPTLKIMTWNMLAQTLVRRELFPNSDCLKASQRDAMLTGEILAYDPDIACLQEVDRLDKHLPILHAAGYDHTYATGPKKLHGCMIIYKAQIFEKVAERIVHYDDVDVNQFLDTKQTASEEPSTSVDDGQSRKRIASTRVTRNIALIVALARKDGSPGCIVATTHAFWHPKYTYERARQLGILLRCVRQMQEQGDFKTWPAYVAGDFNTQPSEAAYSLLTNKPLSPAHLQTFDASRVIHVSLDPTIASDPSTSRRDNDEGGDGESNDPDRAILDARRPQASDALLSNDEIIQLFGNGKYPLRSAYDEALAAVPSEIGNVFSARDPSASCGRNEPLYTSFTFYWKVTLGGVPCFSMSITKTTLTRTIDYIFIAHPLETASPAPRVVGVLKGHRQTDMEPGLPRKGICGSDHVSLMVEIAQDGQDG
ncbi:hypothetical protein FRB99_003493 [Tulasnella sp. 403]|nr:hypothetical protein FRB99_003493 [Tulasnella sp. 403]